jgi:hypothetical protein
VTAALSENRTPRLQEHEDEVSVELKFLRCRFYDLFTGIVGTATVRRPGSTWPIYAGDTGCETSQQGIALHKRAHRRRAGQFEPGCLALIVVQADGLVVDCSIGFAPWS